MSLTAGQRSVCILDLTRFSSRLIKAKDGADPIYKSDAYTFKDTNWFKWEQSKRQDVVNKVETWFQGLIADADIVRPFLLV